MFPYIIISFFNCMTFRSEVITVSNRTRRQPEHISTHNVYIFFQLNFLYLLQLIIKTFEKKEKIENESNHDYVISDLNLQITFPCPFVRVCPFLLWRTEEEDDISKSSRPVSAVPSCPLLQLSKFQVQYSLLTTQCFKGNLNKTQKIFYLQLSIPT